MPSETQIPQYSLVAVRGDTWARTIRFKDSNGDYIPITDWEITLTIKSSREDDDEDADLQKVVTAHTDPDNGLTQISLSAEETDALKGQYFYDIQVVKPNGNVFTFLYGIINFLEDVTRSAS